MKSEEFEFFSTMSRSSRATVGDAWRVQSFLERISGGECGVVTLVGSAPAHACGLGAAPQHLLQQLRRRHTCDHKLQDLRTAELGLGALAPGEHTLHVEVRAREGARSGAAKFKLLEVVQF